TSNGSLTSDLYMKKILLLSAILLGAASASQAGVRFRFGFGLPLPPLPGIVLSAPAPVYAPACAAPVYYSSPYYSAPYCPPAVVVEPYFGYGPRYYGHGWYGRYPHHYYGRGWDRRGSRDNRGSWGHGRGWRR